MKKNHYTKQDASRSIYFVLIMQLALSFLFAMFKTNSFIVYMFQVLIMESLFLAVFWFINRQTKTDGISIVGIKKKPNWVVILLCVLISILVLVLTYHFFGYVDLLFEKIGFKQSENEILTLDKWYKLIIAIFSLALWPAICEELIYRGIVLKGMRGQKGGAIAILCSGFFFAIMHMGMFQLVYQLYLGVIFAIVVIITQDIKNSIIMHFLNNFLVILFTFLQTRYGIVTFFFIKINFWLTLLMFLACSALICLFIYIIKKRTKKQVQEEEIVILDKNTNKIVNVSLIITAVFYIALGVLNSLLI